MSLLLCLIHTVLLIYLVLVLLVLFGILRIFFYPFLVILAEKIAFEEWKGWRMTNA
jgi:hypothetical protein